MKLSELRKNLAVQFGFELLTALYVIAVVLLLWRMPVWTTLSLLAGLGLQLWFWREKSDAATMLAAALLGTPAEMICVKYGVWTYEAPGLMLGIPVWIPLVWAFLFCLFRRITFSFLALTDKVIPEKDSLSKKIFFALLAAVIIVYFTYTVSVINRVIAIVYSCFMLPTVVFWRTRRDITIFIVGGILGTLGEFMCMKLGFWIYHFPYFASIGLPLSLPLAWGLSAVIISRIAGIWDKS